MGTALRPSFYEGQVLAASDLTSLVSYARSALARHDRYQHTPGIVFGLALVGDEKADDSVNTYVDATLTAGAAIDTSGRQVVVDEPIVLIAGEFEQINGAGVDETQWYPVFLRGADVDVQPSEPFAAKTCGSQAMPIRVSEQPKLDYGRLGDARDLPDPYQGGIADGPRPTSGRILVGYVKWSKAARRFSEYSSGPPGSVPIAYAGAAANEVASRDARLELRTSVKRAIATPALWVDPDEGGRLAFGLLNAGGSLDEVFSVSASGDIKATGSVFEGSLTTGTVHVESGMATDGVLLPLPSGITQQQVDDGDVELHMQVTPLVPGSPRPSASHLELAVQCEVDEDRRVHCQTRWFDVAASTVEPTSPAACQYVVIAAVPASPGG